MSTIFISDNVLEMGLYIIKMMIENKPIESNII